ncbi:MAG: hypothetical protein K8I29_14425 [Alphaproteobacteria bacterium]|uniref:Uncharacterized protein n=1 Tax=Candidatus Nitrobium versatile TaxID=2884831 RepID=A0A953JEZ7_9BACT|nr:hypothetical protein [Candidatus Nitrobium versatile]MCC6347904.1 hypothetical protein [Nitrospirales bacterium]
MAKEKAPTILEDAVIAGILSAKGLVVTPQLSDSNRVIYEISGDVESALREVYANAPVGSLDVLRAIKACRSMIFTLRGGSR